MPSRAKVTCGQRKEATIPKLKPRPKSYRETPGPRNRMPPVVLHTPIRAPGRYCATCCPSCGLPTQPSEIPVVQIEAWRSHIAYILYG